MANKAFEIQNSTLKIGGVELQAGTTGVVIPGVTQATNYRAEEVEDGGGDDTNVWQDIPVVIDQETYNRLAGIINLSDGWVAPTYEVEELDDDGKIDGIQVIDGGTIPNETVVAHMTDNMFAAPAGSSIDPQTFDANIWVAIPYYVKCRAGEIETIGSGGGGSGTLKDIYVTDEIKWNIVAVDIESNSFFVTGNASDALDAREYANIDIAPPQIAFGIGDWNYDSGSNRTQVWLDGQDYEITDNSLIGAKLLTIKKYSDKTSILLSNQFSVLDAGGLAISLTGGSGSGINFDADDAINLQGQGVIRNTTDSGNANLVAVGYSQLQWTTQTGAAEANPNDTTEPKNWVYVDDTGVTIETNINAVNNLGSRQWLYDNSGGLWFPDGTVQTTAYQGGGSVVTNLWIACGNNPSGAMAVSSTDGVNWTTHDYTALPNINFSKLAISEDKIVYIGSDSNSPGDGLYYASAPEDTPVLAAGTDVFPNSQNTVNWNEINYLGGYFIATGSYRTQSIIPATVTNIVLAADAGRTTAVITLNTTEFDFAGTYITISGANNAELNGNFQLHYNELDTVMTGVYEIYNTDGSPITLTSTDVTGAVVASTNPENLNWPTFIYSTNGVDWTYGNIDSAYYDAVLGSYPNCQMSDVAYNGTGYLIPVTDDHFSIRQDTPSSQGPGAFYITDITGFVGAPQFIVGGGEGYGLPGTFNNIASFGDGTFFVSDDKYYIWTAADPTGTWTAHSIESALVSLFGYAVGPQDVNGDVDSAVNGTVGGMEMWVATTNAGAVIYTTNNGLTFQGSIPDPITSTATVAFQGSATIISVAGDWPYENEIVTITVANGDDTNWNGTYKVALTGSPGDFQLLNLNGQDIVSDGFTTPSNPMTVVMSHGRDLDAIHVADDVCIVHSSESNKLYRSTDMVNWTTVFTNQFYGIDDIYYAGRPVTGLPIGIANGENSLTIDADGNITLDNTTDGAHDRGLFWRWGSRNGGTDAGLYHDEDGITLQSFSDDTDYVNGSPVNIVTNPGPTQNKWSFNTDGGLVFPDNSKQTTAYVHRNINFDGGGAAVHFEQEVGYIDGGFSATRHGVADPTFDGGNRLTESNQYNINGGGA